MPEQTNTENADYRLKSISSKSETYGLEENLEVKKENSEEGSLFFEDAEKIKQYNSHPPLKILYEDNHLIAVYKPFGMPSQDDISGDLSVNTWLKFYLKKTYDKGGNVYLAQLHRIDRPVGGVLIFGKTSKAAGRMSEMFKEKKLVKSYLAVTENIPAVKSGTLEHFLIKLIGKNIVKAFNHAVPDSKKCILNYETLKTSGSRALVKVIPITGRQHQIRVQLSAIGCPITGDVKYGCKRPNPDGCIALLSSVLEFEHPVTHKPVKIEANPPEDSIWSDFR